jgi:D-alanyl-D-alanine dipeptidase
MKHRWLAAVCLLFPVLPAIAGAPGSRASEPLVEISAVDPTIVIDLRYGTSRNLFGHAIYPPGARAVVRQSVADRLKVAQAYLHARGYGLKIWDAFRPFNAQGALWAFAQSARFVADPENGHALHTWGAAVDATLVDAKGREAPMPSDFDAFSPAAALSYQGNDETVRRDLDLLLHAMGAAGFKGMRSEWWHFVAPDWSDFALVTPDQARVFAGPSVAAGKTP